MNYSQMESETKKSMTKILVCMTTECFRSLKHHDGHNSVVISDLSGFDVMGEIISPNDFNNEKCCVYSLSQFFDKFANSARTELLKGFSNNLYECSVAPIASYLLALDYALSITDQKHTQVWFSRGFLVRRFSSAYYMAEHESQGYHLYDRRAIFTPYLAELATQRNIGVYYHRRIIGIKQYFSEVVRLWIVYFIRFVADLKKKKKLSNVSPSNTVNAILISRSIAQTNAVRGFLLHSKLVTHVIAGSSFLDRGSNAACVKAIASQEDMLSWSSGGGPSYLEIIRSYVSIIGKIAVKQKDVKVTIKGVVIDLSQAINEVFTMLPELVSYQKFVERSIIDVPHKNEDTILISLEQKSPHGFVEALVAKNLGYKSVQIMTCDQFPRMLPKPVFGDLFLADTPLMADRLMSQALGDGSKIKYIGSIKYINFFNKKNTFPIQLLSACKLNVFILGSTSEEDNVAVISYLKRELDPHKYRLFFKPHPRDKSERRYLRFKIDLVKDLKLEKNLWLSGSYVAVTFPSGVVTDLILSGVPTIILSRANSSVLQSYWYWDDSSAICTTKKSDVLFLLKEPSKFQVEYRKYRDRWLNMIGVSSDSNDESEAVMFAIKLKAALQDI